MCGAPKGILNLTCGFQAGPVGLAEYRIVAGHAAFVVSVCPAQSQLAAGRLSASSARKAREWHVSAQSGRSLQPGVGF